MANYYRCLPLLHELHVLGHPQYEVGSLIVVDNLESQTVMTDL
jgi:hypothetical protein